MHETDDGATESISIAQHQSMAIQPDEQHNSDESVSIEFEAINGLKSRTDLCTITKTTL